MDGAAGQVAEQVRRIDQPRAAAVDRVDVHRHDVALAAERDRDIARIRRPFGIVGARRRIEIVVLGDVVEGGEPAMTGLRHQVDMEMVAAARAVAMGRHREFTIRRLPAVDDGKFALRVIVLGRGMGQRERGQRKGKSEDGAAELHGCLSPRQARAFNGRLNPPA